MGPTSQTLTCRPTGKSEISSTVSIGQSRQPVRRRKKYNGASSPSRSGTAFTSLTSPAHLTPPPTIEDSSSSVSYLSFPNPNFPVYNKNEYSPRSVKWIETLHPIVEVYDYTPSDVVKLVKSHNYDDEYIQLDVSRIIESASNRVQGNWELVKNRKQKREEVRRQAAISSSSEVPSKVSMKSSHKHGLPSNSGASNGPMNGIQINHSAQSTGHERKNVVTVQEVENPQNSNGKSYNRNDKKNQDLKGNVSKKETLRKVNTTNLMNRASLEFETSTSHHLKSSIHSEKHSSNSAISSQSASASTSAPTSTSHSHLLTSKENETQDPLQTLSQLPTSTSSLNEFLLPPHPMMISNLTNHLSNPSSDLVTQAALTSWASIVASAKTHDNGLQETTDPWESDAEILTKEGEDKQESRAEEKLSTNLSTLPTSLSTSPVKESQTLALSPSEIELSSPSLKLEPPSAPAPPDEPVRLSASAISMLPTRLIPPRKVQSDQPVVMPNHQTPAYFAQPGLTFGSVNYDSSLLHSESTSPPPSQVPLSSFSGSPLTQAVTHVTLDTSTNLDSLSRTSATPQTETKNRVRNVNGQYDRTTVRTSATALHASNPSPYSSSLQTSVSLDHSNLPENKTDPNTTSLSLYTFPHLETTTSPSDVANLNNNTNVKNELTTRNLPIESASQTQFTESTRGISRSSMTELGLGMQTSVSNTSNPQTLSSSTRPAASPDTSFSHDPDSSKTNSKSFSVQEEEGPAQTSSTSYPRANTKSSFSQKGRHYHSSGHVRLSRQQQWENHTSHSTFQGEAASASIASHSLNSTSHTQQEGTPLPSGTLSHLPLTTSATSQRQMKNAFVDKVTMLENMHLLPMGPVSQQQGGLNQANAHENNNLYLSNAPPGLSPAASVGMGYAYPNVPYSYNGFQYNPNYPQPLMVPYGMVGGPYATKGDPTLPYPGHYNVGFGEGFEESMVAYGNTQAGLSESQMAASYNGGPNFNGLNPSRTGGHLASTHSTYHSNSGISQASNGSLPYQSQTNVPPGFNTHYPMPLSKDAPNNSETSPSSGSFLGVPSSAVYNGNNQGGAVGFGPSPNTWNTQSSNAPPSHYGYTQTTSHPSSYIESYSRAGVTKESVSNPNYTSANPHMGYGSRSMNAERNNQGGYINLNNYPQQPNLYNPPGLSGNTFGAQYQQQGNNHYSGSRGNNAQPFLGHGVSVWSSN